MWCSGWFTLLLVQVVGAFAADGWVTKDSALVRWLEDDSAFEVTIGNVEVGEAVTVLSRDGENVRIQRGTDFGWVPADVVSDTPPDGDVAAEEGEAPAGATPEAPANTDTP